MTAHVHAAGWPRLRATHAFPLSAIARPARGRRPAVATLISVVEHPSLVLAAGRHLTGLLEHRTGLTRCGPVVVRYTTDPDQALTLLASDMVTGVCSAADVERTLDDFIAVGPPGVLLVACCYQLWPQHTAVRAWS